MRAVHKTKKVTVGVTDRVTDTERIIYGGTLWELIDIASSKSVWRGMEYYKQNKVLSYTVNEDGSCEGIVAGSGDGNYHVHVDMEHPRKSTCDCPLANGKKIICKHIVAVSLCLDESEADRFKNEKTIYASEEEERIRAKKHMKRLNWICQTMG